MKLLIVLGFSLIILLLGSLKAEGVLRFREKLYGENPKKYRKKKYISVVIAWIIAVIILTYKYFNQNNN